MKRLSPGLLAVAAASFLVSCSSTTPDREAARDVAERMVAQAYPGMPPALTKRAEQDESARICSRAGGRTLSQEEAQRIVELARSNVRYPDGKPLLGDWKRGQALALNGTGERIRDGRVEKVAETGANCYACHTLAPDEVNAGNLGPSLTGYGRNRGMSPEIVRYTYDKIFNAWAFYPCSNMPRMGHNGYLTPEQITHVVAFLLDPASPVNR